MAKNAQKETQPGQLSSTDPETPEEPKPNERQLHGKVSVDDLTHQRSHRSKELKEGFRFGV